MEALKKLAESGLDAEGLQSNFEDGWGGNSDDAYRGGYDQGQAELARDILAGKYGSIHID